MIAESYDLLNKFTAVKCLYWKSNQTILIYKKHIGISTILLWYRLQHFFQDMPIEIDDVTEEASTRVGLCGGDNMLDVSRMEVR